VTPFGEKVRALRAERGIALKDMAEEIGVTPTYLSALEHGRRGKPTWDMLQRIIQYFNVIWDDAEELQRLAMLSHPRVTIDTAGLPPSATLFANRLQRCIADLGSDELDALHAVLDGAARRR
jgi:transcriptional regulator with XRE-family HTH domain